MELAHLEVGKKRGGFRQATLGHPWHFQQLARSIVALGGIKEGLIYTPRFSAQSV